MKTLLFLTICVLLYTFAYDVSFALPSAEYDALVDLYFFTHGNDWKWLQPYSYWGYPWNISYTFYQNPCNSSYPWQGVQCTSDCSLIPCHVQNLTLNNRFLTGNLPSSIGNLIFLTNIDLSYNSLTGSIPITIENLLQLQHVDFHTNKLNGSIPMHIGNLTQLRYFFLSFNRLSGSIPTTVGKLIQLQYLGLCGNQLTGSIPSSIGNLLQLQLLILNNNALSKQLPSQLGNLVLLEDFMVNDNLLTGSIPDTIGNLVKLQYLYLYENLLSHTIPTTIHHLQELQYFSLHSNLLTGTIPINIGNLSNMIVLTLYNNQLQGNIPDSIGNCSQLIQLLLHQNRFTSTIPNAMNTLHVLQQLNLSSNLFSDTMVSDSIQSLYALQYLDLSYNLLQGDIPTINTSNTTNKKNSCSLVIYNLRHNLFSHSFLTNTFCKCLNLQQIDVTENILSGTIPSVLLPSPSNDNNTSNCFHNLNLLQFSHNQFTGPLPLGYITNALQVLYMNENQFTGSIPNHWFDLAINLQQLGLAQNCLSGTIPDSICTSTMLQHVSLDGLHSSCVTKIIPFYSDSGFYTSQLVYGHLPDCLFQFPSLSQLQLSGNAFTGTLPSLNISSKLVTLILANNQFSGTIPLAIWYHSQLTYLDVSFNRFQDTFPALPFPPLLQQLEISNTSQTTTNNTSNSTNLVYYFQNNRFSGTIPLILQSVKDINILEGNQFTCAIDRNDLPYYDPQYQSYDCGSDETNNSMIVWIVIVGILVIIMSSMILLINNNNNKGNKRMMKTLVNFIVLQYGYIQQYWSIYKNTLAITNTTTTTNTTTNTNTNTITIYPHLQKTHILLMLLWKLCLLIMLFGMIGLLPLYSVLNTLYRTHDYAYIWIISSSYLSGQYPASMLCIVYLMILIGLLCVMIYAMNSRHHKDDNNSDNNSDNNDNNSDVINDDDKEEVKEEEEVIVMNNSNNNSNKKHGKWYLIQLQYYIFFLFNIIIVCGVNMAYVYIVVIGHYNIITITIVSFLLSIFKLIWNNLILGGILYQFIITTICTDISLQGIHFLLLSLLNNIIIPYFAQALVSPTCFLYAIQLPPVINIYLLQFHCTIMNYIINNELFPIITCSENSYDRTTYYPSFNYTYQCSSSLVAAFTHVFVYRYLLSGIVLPLGYCMIQYYLIASSSASSASAHQQRPRTSSPAAAATASSFSIRIMNKRQLLRKLLPVLWRLHTTAATVSGENDRNDDEVKEDYIKFTQKIHQSSFGNTLAIEIMTSVAMMLTFGISFPLLMIIIAVSVGSHILSYMILLGRWMYFIQQQPQQHHHQQQQQQQQQQDEITSSSHFIQHQQALSQLLLYVDAEKFQELPKLFAQGFVLCIGIATMFLSFSLFDILGDDVDAIHAYWIVLVMCMTMLFFLVLSVMKTMKVIHKKKEKKCDNDNKTNNNVVEEHCGEHSLKMEVISNPILDQI